VSLANIYTVWKVMKSKLFNYFAFIFVLFLFSACATSPVQVNPNYDLSKINRIAVLGFEPYNGLGSSGSVMSTIFEKMLVSMGIRLVERQQVEEFSKNKISN